MSTLASEVTFLFYHGFTERARPVHTFNHRDAGLVALRGDK